MVGASEFQLRPLGRGNISPWELYHVAGVPLFIVDFHKHDWKPLASFAMTSPPSHPLQLDQEQLKNACSITRTRRGGPGGQHRNKVETAIVITHDASGISAQAGEERSQHANLTTAIARLKVNLAIGVRSDPLPTAPSALWKSRVKNRRIAVSRSHADYPIILTTALDALALAENDIVAAAKFLEISTSQLIKFFKIHPQVFDHVQRTRRANGLGTLK